MKKREERKTTQTLEREKKEYAIFASRIIFDVPKHIPDRQVWRYITEREIVNIEDK